jgi:hypothetical protein
MCSRKKVGISKLRSCGLEGRTHCDGFAELAGLFETFGRDVRVNKKSQMHTDKLGWTYRYVVWKMENRYRDVGPGQVQGRQEIKRLREQQDNVTGGIWYRKGKSAGVSTCMKKLSRLVGDVLGRLTNVIQKRSIGNSVHLASNMRVQVICSSIAEPCPRSST